MSWPYALIFLATFVWVFAPEFRIAIRRGEGSGTPQDANSKLILMMAQYVGMVAAFVIAATVPFGRLPYPLFFFWLGLAAMIAGGLLRRHCQRMLGSSFTGAVIVTAGHAVVERGAYRYVRHPSYTAALIIYFGIGTALGNWISLVALLAVICAAFLYRVSVEERALTDVIGDPYREYVQRTKRFVPLVF